MIKETLKLPLNFNQCILIRDEVTYKESLSGKKFMQLISVEFWDIFRWWQSLNTDNVSI